MKTYPDQLANPFTELDDQGRPINYHLGLTKREHFAGLAMQGIAAMYASPKAPGKISPQELARQSVLSADVLIQELNKEPKP